MISTYIHDIDMYTFIENSWGGVTTTNHRHFKANNEYLNEFNPDEPTSFIHYIDANNLYGASMCQKMPTGNFRWLNQSDIEQMDVTKMDADGDTCYILECELEYPTSLHDYHNDYPLAVEGKLITEDQLSPYNKEFLKNHKERFKATRKLCPDLHDKHSYVCSLKNLQFFLQRGIKLKKIHRVLAADQSNFLKPYIDFNSAKRQHSKSKFEQDFFKLANNSIYGKFIESLRNRTNVDIVKDTTAAKRLTSKPQYLGFHILDDNITIVQSIKRTITLNKPIACGFIVLENSKIIMGDFWYGVMKPRYGDQIKLLLSDTDSFVYAVYTADGYKDLYDLREYMDLSDYREDTCIGQFHDSTNKKIPGKFSDEKPKEIIEEVIALKPKMYSILTKKLVCEKAEEHEKFPNHVCVKNCFTGHKAIAKGIPEASKKSISHEDYRKVLELKNTTMTTARTIRSFNNKLYSIAIQKRGLSAYDDKKYILADGVNTLSYGHYLI